MDRLENIIQSDWPKLRDLFLPNWPAHLLAYRTIQHYIDVKKKNPLYKVHVFCLNNDWSDGTFITYDGFHAQVYTLEESCERLQRAFECFPKCTTMRVSCTPEKFSSIIRNSMKKSGFDDPEIIVTDFYWIPKEEAIKLDCSLPPETYLAPVGVGYAKRINSYWPSKFQMAESNYEYGPHWGEFENNKKSKYPKSSEDWIRDMILHSPSLGLYNADGEMMSWVMILHNDGLCALQTENQHLRKGYGSVIIRNMSKTFALQGKDTFGFIVVGNSPSVRLFNDLGFQVIGRTYWFLADYQGSDKELQELRRLYDWN